MNTNEPEVSEAEVVNENEQPAPAASAAPVDPMSLAQAISSGASNPMSLLLSQLSAQAPDDPRVALATQLLQQRISAAPAVPPEDAEHAKAAQEAEEQLREQAASIRELTESLKQVDAELKALRARNDAIAAALGACFLCFGADPYCPECGGRGRSGSRPPNPVAWREYVLPALERVRKLQSMKTNSGLRPPAHAPIPPSAGAA
jgi:hypothetical protein